MKKSYLTLILSFILILGSTKVLFAESGKSLTFSGSTGFINIPEVDVISGFAVSLILPTSFNHTAILPRFAVGFKNILEFFGGVDVPTTSNGHLSGLFGIKWDFLKGSAVNLGLIGNLQLNNLSDKLHFNPQFLLALGWTTGAIETNLVAGKTLGDFTDKNTWDFGIGVKWWFYNSGNFSMAWVTDFANYNYRQTVNTEGLPVGSNARGNVSTALRFGFLGKKITLDIGALDLFDSNRAFLASVGYNQDF